MKNKLFIVAILATSFCIGGLKNYSFEIENEPVCETIKIEPKTFAYQDDLSDLEMLRYSDYRTVLNFKLDNCENGSPNRSYGEQRKNDELSISIDSLNNLGIVTIDIKATDANTNEDISNRIYAYPSINSSNGKKDVKIDLYGHILTGSEILAESKNGTYVESGNSRLSPRPGIGIVDFNKIVEIVLDLIDLEDVDTLVSMMIDVPILSIDNPLPYFLYMVKVESAKSHYISNSNLESNTPIDGYIENQKLLSNYQYGLAELPFHFQDENGQELKTNIGASGCGVVAVYNMLLDSGANITFSALIALFELCGADLLFGYLGVNPIPDYYDLVIIPAATALLSMVYSTVLQPLFNLCLTLIEPLLYGLLGFTPADLLVPGFSVTVVVLAVTTLRILINDAGRMITELIAWYLDYMKSEFEILTLFYGTYVHEYPIFNFVGFENHMSLRGQGIICYWNKINEDGTINFSGGAHYIYIQKGILDPLFTAHNNFGNINTCAVNLFERLFGSDRIPGVPGQYIWGYVLSDENDWGSNNERQ